MIEIEKGRYWDEGIKLVSGCTKCSPGCDHCWSLAMEKRFLKKMSGIDNIASVNHVEPMCHPDRLKRFNTRKPKVFAIWNDLFHEAVPWEFIFDIFRKINHVGPIDRHTFLFLTKRPERMLEAWKKWGGPALSQIYSGLTVCNQQEWNKHKGTFLSVPGKKFISHEPALERIDYGEELKEIGVLISGGETGSGARPSHPDTFRSDRDQCAAAGVPFFFKGWGRWNPTPPAVLYASRTKLIDGQVVYVNKEYSRLLDVRTHDELPWRKGGI